MAASKCCRNVGWLAALWLGSTELAHAESISRAELTCRLSSGNLWHDEASASVTPEAPWQDLASRGEGDGNRARLTLAAAELGFLPSVTTSALLRLELSLNQGAEGSASGLRDASSSVALAWQLAPATVLSLRAFPLDTDYVRVGYLHALDWGGTDGARGQSVFLLRSGLAPGLQVSLAAPGVAVFAAVKWATAADALRGPRRLWGGLSGASVELGPALRVDGGFGYFQRAVAGAGAVDAATPGFIEGASLRLVWHRGTAEPELSPEPFRPPSLREAPTRLEAEATPGVALAFESVVLVERLRRFEAPSIRALTPAPAAALYGSARGRRLAAHAALSWRSLAFVLRNDTRLAGGETLPASAVEHAELTAWLGGSFTWLPLRLVPSFEVGARLPAALQTPSRSWGYGQTLVAGGAAGFEALPVGAGRLPVVSGRLGLRFQASASLGFSLNADYQRDPNRSALLASSAGSTREFVNPDSLAVSVAARARF